VARFAPSARVVEMGDNTGFAAGADAGAEVAQGELLLLLNPDARPLPGFRQAIVRPWIEERGWAAWMGLVACNDAHEVNTAGNPVHFTGFAWSGDHGEPLREIERREVTALSGACMALPLETFRRLDGFPAPYFLYHEDVDLSMRLQLEGERLGLEPSAVVDHDYEFEGPEKMRWLERNRWAMVLRTYPGALLALLAPALLLTELALIPISIAGGWGGQKLLADLDGLRRLPWALRTRREIQRRRTVSAADFAAWLTPDLDSPFFGRAGRSRILRLALRTYWRLVRFLLGPTSAGESGAPRPR
jgi:GT2 family glycosyltransferase